jgi:hypothetical protein
MDRTTGSTSAFRLTSFTSIRGLTSGPAADLVLYGARDAFGDTALVRIALDNTGTDTIVGIIGVDDVEGLAYDANADRLYGITWDGLLLEIDRSTGEAVATVGNLGTTGFESLAFDDSSGLLYSVLELGLPTGAQVVTIDPLAPAAVVLADLTGHDLIGGLAFFQETLYAVTQDTQRLLAIDISAGPVTFSDVGPVAFDEFASLAAYEEP